MPNSEIINSPVGRFVSGSLTEKRTVDFEGRPIPEDKQQFEIGVAFSKADPEVNTMLGAIAQHAWNEYSRFPNIQQIIGSWNFDAFSWKISDGDRPNKKGQTSENTVGHWVLYLKSSFPINCCDNRNAQCSPEVIKRGHYVDLAFTVAGNGETGDRAGIYINPQMVRWIAYGKEITGGITADQAFAGRPVPTHLPAGASQTPLAGGAMPGTGSPTMPGNGPTGTSMPGAPGAMPSGGPSAPGMPGATGASPSNGPMPGNQGPAGLPSPSQPSNVSVTTGYPGSGVPPHPTFANGPQG